MRLWLQGVLSCSSGTEDLNRAALASLVIIEHTQRFFIKFYLNSNFFDKFQNKFNVWAKLYFVSFKWLSDKFVILVVSSGSEKLKTAVASLVQLQLETTSMLLCTPRSYKGFWRICSSIVIWRLRVYNPIAFKI